MIAAVNWSVDPYNELQRNTIGIYFSVERQVKSDIVRFPHDAVLIGTSKIGGIDPEMLNCYKFYNSAFSGALPEEVYYYLKRYLTHERLVVIALDFEMFNERQWPIKRMEEWNEHSFGKFEYLINFNTFRSSLIALYKWQNKEPILIEPNGQRSNPKKRRGIGMTTGLVHTEHDFTADLEMLASNHFRRFLMSKERLEYLRKTKLLLESKKIPYVIFINPYNQHLLDLIKSLGEEGLLNTWREDVRSIFPEVRDFSQSEYSLNDDYFGSTDVYHFNAEVGAKIINSIIPCEKK
jgi:hypothetical protein